MAKPGRKPGTPKTGGRKPGVKNKVQRTCRENILKVFEAMGGSAAMAKWAKENPTEYYKIYSRLLPQEVSGPGGGPIQVQPILNVTIGGNKS